MSGCNSQGVPAPTEGVPSQNHNRNSSLHYHRPLIILGSWARRESWLDSCVLNHVLLVRSGTCVGNKHRTTCCGSCQLLRCHNEVFWFCIMSPMLISTWRKLTVPLGHQTGEDHQINGTKSQQVHVQPI